MHRYQCFREVGLRDVLFHNQMLECILNGQIPYELPCVMLIAGIKQHPLNGVRIPWESYLDLCVIIVFPILLIFKVVGCSDSN